MNQIVDWIKSNWHEESNMGKAKLGALAALAFLLVSSLLPDSDQDSLTQELSGAPAHERLETDTLSPLPAPTTTPPIAAPETTDQTTPSTAVSAENADEEAAEQAAAAYRAYENRVAALEQERRELAAKLSEGGDLDAASDEAAAAYRGYEARIAELEQEKRELTEEMTKLRSDDEAEVAAAYASYAARVADLEQEKAAGEREAAAAYGQYEARVTELEDTVKGGAEQAAATYSDYEQRVAELERENRILNERLTAAEQALTAKTQRIAELEGSGRVFPNSEQAGGINPELQRQLRDLRGELDQVLQKLEEVQTTAPN